MWLCETENRNEDTNNENIQAGFSWLSAITFDCLIQYNWTENLIIIAHNNSFEIKVFPAL